MTAIPNLSTFIITKNEDARIGMVLEAINGLCDDIIIIDSGSTDKTIEIAKKYGAKVIFNEWPGYGRQKQIGEDYCKNDWLLNLDADEVLTDELKSEIREFFANSPEPMGVKLKIAEMLPNETKVSKFSYILAPVRLYHRKIGRYNPSPVHDRVDIVQGTQIIKMKNLIAHFSVQSLSQQTVKLNSYSDAQTRDLIAKNRRFSIIRLIFEFPLAFLKAYLGRFYILKGRKGFVHAIAYAYFRFARIAKLFEENEKTTKK